MIRTVPRCGLLAGCVLLALAASPSGEQPGKLTAEDIVRGFVAGQSASQLIELIERSAVDFDLSPDMLQEFRAAGLPGGVIEAMQRRQREQDALAQPPDADLPHDAPPSITVLLNKDAAEDDSRVLRFPDLIPPELHAELGLGSEVRHFTDAAIFLACTTDRHVPDQWRSKTPLGRDFVKTPRHRLLAWSSGARRMDAGKLAEALGKLAQTPDRGELGILELDVPPQLAGEPQPGDTHDLILGIALEAGGRFWLIKADTWDGALPDHPLSAKVKRRGGLASLEYDVLFRRDAPRSP